MDGVRAARTRSLATLLGDWNEEDLRTLGAMFAK